MGFTSLRSTDTDSIRIRHYRIISIHTIVGAFSGYILLRLLALGVYWYEFRKDIVGQESFFRFVVEETQHYSLATLSFSIIMLSVGAFIGLCSGLLTVSLLNRELKLMLATRELGSSLKQLIAKGEDENTEFKSSVRWDLREEKINKNLEHVIIKTMAGLLNHRGGNLIIGIADDGKTVGIESDYRTLKQADRDGFAQHLMTLVKTHIGADICAFVYPIFHSIDDMDVCRVMLTRSPRPVYIQHNGNTDFYLRTGNGTCALNIQEAVAYIKQRWPRS